MENSKLADRRPIPRLGLSRAELAISIGVSAGSVDQMVAEGMLPPPRIWHTRKIWLLAEVETYILGWPTDGTSAEIPSEHSFSQEDAPPKISTRRDPLQDHYDAIGFDPTSMDGEDYRRLYAEAHAKWLAEIPDLPLNKSELHAIKQLAQKGVGTFAAHNEIKGCGLKTQERLQARGYIQVRMKSPDRIDGYTLTAAGFSAARAT